MASSQGANTIQSSRRPPVYNTISNHDYYGLKQEPPALQHKQKSFEVEKRPSDAIRVENEKHSQSADLNKSYEGRSRQEEKQQYIQSANASPMSKSSSQSQNYRGNETKHTEPILRSNYRDNEARNSDGRQNLS